MGQDILKQLVRFAARSKRRVGIGIGEHNPVLLRAAAQSTRFSDVVWVGNVEDVAEEAIASSEPEHKLVEMLVEGAIDAAVRGTLSAQKTLHELKEHSRAPLCRAALLSSVDDRQFFLLPVGIDEVTSLRERTGLATKTAGLLSALGIAPHVGILSGGRSEDAGRIKAVDATLQSAQELTNRLKERGIDATNYNILIEDAVKSSNILVAPDGISGNLIFRTLVFLGAGSGHGAPFFGLPFTFVDTSRAGAAFGDAIIMACALCNLAQW